MTKTHAKLLNCPFCGSEKVRVFIDAIVICEICGCQTKGHSSKEKSIAIWNSRVNKEAEFLEELKRHLNMRIVRCDDMKRKDIARDRRIVYVDILEQIEQFEAEQKVSDDNINI